MSETASVGVLPVYDEDRESAVVTSVERALTLTKSEIEGQYHYDQEVIDKAVMMGDMRSMSPEMRLNFYNAVCWSVGLNPLTQPFTVLARQDKTTWLYANANAAQQLAKIHGVSFLGVTRTHDEIDGEPTFTVTGTVSLPSGRCVQEIAVVSLTKKKRVQNGNWPSGDPKFVDVLDKDGEPILIKLHGEQLMNAMMRCNTKFMRRGVMAICGLGWMMQERPSVATPQNLDLQTGELREEPARVPLMDRPAEAEKTLQAHISDLFE